MPVTTLGRAIDPRYGSNRTILILGAIGAAAGWFRWSTDLLGESAIAAGSVGLLVVMAWALAREIDPDRPTSATVAGVLTLVVALLVESIAVLPLVGLMVTGRILIRSTGLPPTALDLIVLTGGAFLLGRTGAGWVAALVLAFAIARDRTLPGLPTSRLARIVVPFLMPIVASVAVVLYSEELWELPPWWMIATGGAGAVAAVLLPPYEPVSRCDLRGEPLEPRRLQSARRVIFVGALLVSALGAIGVKPMLPVWLTFIAVWVTHAVPLPEFHPDPAGKPIDSP